MISEVSVDLALTPRLTVNCCCPHLSFHIQVVAAPAPVVNLFDSRGASLQAYACFELRVKLGLIF